jgi:hypothetical protein
MISVFLENDLADQSFCLVMKFRVASIVVIFCYGKSPTPDSASLKCGASKGCMSFSVSYWLFWPLSIGRGHGTGI